jgi:hypothetical protein
MENVFHRILSCPPNFEVKQPPNLIFHVDFLVDDNYIQIKLKITTEITDGESNVNLWLVKNTKPISKLPMRKHHNHPPAPLRNMEGCCRNRLPCCLHASVVRSLFFASWRSLPVEGQWNTSIKLYYPRHLMSEAETTGILRKMMFWEYGLFARLMLGSTFGDLQSCYDRIMTFFSNIASRKKEMLKENCISPYFTQNI